MIALWNQFRPCLLAKRRFILEYEKDIIVRLWDIDQRVWYDIDQFGFMYPGVSYPDDENQPKGEVIESYIGMILVSMVRKQWEAYHRE